MGCVGWVAVTGGGLSLAGQRAATTMANIMPQLLAPAPCTPRGPYEVIASTLREQIHDGRLTPGDLLPTMSELATAHTVCTATVHRAVALLRDEGLIHVSRGRRAVVLCTNASSQVQ
ncbi:MAG: winged helix-turn-helix domain-containing protein [Pseudonocardiaceae bacterium]